MLPLPVMSFIKSPLFKYFVMFLVVAGILFFTYRAGSNAKQAEWDAAQASAEKEKAELEVKTNEVTTKVETVYVDKIQIVKEKGKTITKYVDRVITKEMDKECTIPNAFVALHDSAVLNRPLKMSEELSNTGLDNAEPGHPYLDLVKKGTVK